MKNKLILKLICFFCLLIFVGCSEESVDVGVNNILEGRYYIKILSISPSEGSTIKAGTVIKATLSYKSQNDYSTFRIHLMFKTPDGHVANGNNPDTRIPFTYNDEKQSYFGEYKHSYKVTSFELKNQMLVKPYQVKFFLVEKKSDGTFKQYAESSYVTYKEN